MSKALELGLSFSCIVMWMKMTEKKVFSWTNWLDIWGLFPLQKSLAFYPFEFFWISRKVSCLLDGTNAGQNWTMVLLQKFEKFRYPLAICLAWFRNLYPSFFVGTKNVCCCRRTRSQSCPFCRDCLKRVDSGDLWVFMDSRDVIDMATLTRENLRRLFMYIDKLPLVVPVTLYDPYDSHLR